MRNLTYSLATSYRHGASAVAGWLRQMPIRGVGSKPRLNRAVISQRLQVFNEQFTAHYQRTDAEFGALAKSLRELYTIARALADLVSERLGSMRNALNESRIAGPDGVAAASLQDLRDGLAEASAELTVLQSVGEGLQQLHVHIAKVERVGLSVRTAVFGFAVESARSGQCQQTFGSFAADLRSLGDRITSVAGAINSHITATGAAQQKEWRALSASHAQLLQLVEELKTAAQSSADEAQKIFDHVLQGLQAAGECMRQITHHTEEAVFYLQFGDIIRQKTEHIAEALREITGPLHSAASVREFSAGATVGDRVTAIQIRQLELVRQEVESAQNQLAKSFQALAEQTARIHGTLVQWHTPPAGSRKQADPLEAFQADLLRMENLHRQGHELQLEARRSTRNAAEASRQLADQVRGVKALNSDMHLQALNAIVKTAALGEEGATLSVLSMHVDSLYGDSQGIVADIVAIVDSVLTQTGAHTEGQDLGEKSVRSERLRAGIKQIESAGDECRTTFSSADKLIGQQQQSLEATGPLLRFLAEQKTAIQSQIEELTAIREMLAPWKNQADAVVSPDEISNDRYTMQSERDIHDSAGQAAPGLAGAEPEFFELPKPKEDEAAMLPPEAKQHNPEGQEAPVVSPAPASGASMGDNVELF